METIELSVEEKIKKWGVQHTMGNIKQLLKTERLVICYNMDEPEDIMLNEISQSQKENICTRYIK